MIWSRGVLSIHVGEAEAYLFSGAVLDESRGRDARTASWSRWFLFKDSTREKAERDQAWRTRTPLHLVPDFNVSFRRQASRSLRILVSSCPRRYERLHRSFLDGISDMKRSSWKSRFRLCQESGNLEFKRAMYQTTIRYLQCSLYVGTPCLRI